MRATAAMFALSLIVVSLPLPGVAATLAQPSKDLRSWLSSLVLGPLPAIQIPKMGEVPGLPLNITGGNCTNLLLNRVAAVNESNTSAAIVRLALQDVSINCTADLVMTGFGEVTAQVQIANLNMSVSLAISHDDTKPPLPTVVGWSASGAKGCLIEPGLKLTLQGPRNQSAQNQADLNRMALFGNILINGLAGPKVCSAIDGMLRNKSTKLLNNTLDPLLPQFLSNPDFKPAPQLPAVPGGVVELNQTVAVDVILSMLNDTLHFSNVSAMNTKLSKLLAGVTKPQPMKKSWTFPLGSDTKIRLAFDGDMQIDIGRFNKLRLSASNTTTGVAVDLKEAGLAWKGKARLEALPTHGTASAYELNIGSAGFNVSNLQVDLLAQLGLERRKLDALKFDQLMTKAGFLSMIDCQGEGQFKDCSSGLELLGLSLNITPGLNLKLGDRTATATGEMEPHAIDTRRLLTQQAPLEEMIASSVDTMSWTILGVYGDTIRSLLNGALGSLGVLFANGALASMAQNSGPVSRSKLQDDIWAAYINTAAAPTLPIMFATLALFIFCGRRLYAMYKQGKPQPESPTLGLSPRLDMGGKRKSLLFSGAVSVPTGIAIVMLILANIFVFLGASTGFGTSLYVNLTRNGQTTAIGAIHWSLMSSFKQMINAQAYVLAWVVMFASGIWPYSKLVSLLLAMVVKPMNGYFGVQLRQSVLVLVDTVGKISLLDSFFMWLYESLIAVKWSNESGSEKLSATVEAEAGFLLFFGATIVCLLLGHVVLYIHRLALHQHTTSSSSGGERFSLQYAAPHWQKLAVPLLLFASCALFPFALLMTSLRTQVTGALGFFYNLVDEDPFLNINIWFVVTGPWRALGYGKWEQFGPRFVLVSLAALFVVVLPALFCLSLVTLWFVPLRRKWRFHGLAVIQCLRAWAALDVCAFTFLVATYFGPPFFKGFTMNPSQAFHGICSGMYDSLGIYCFDLNVTPQAGLWVAIGQSLSVLVASVLISQQADRWLNMSGEIEHRTLTETILSTNSMIRTKSQLSFPSVVSVPGNGVAADKV